MFVQSRPSDPGERRLLSLWRQMPAAHRETLLAFAEFLLQREAEAAGPEPEVAPPEPIPRPAEESVVKAIKRLTRTYPMLDRSVMLGETSELVSQHVLQGRAARDVIDDLETIFRRRYDKLAEDHSGTPND